MWALRVRTIDALYLGTCDVATRRRQSVPRSDFGGPDTGLPASTEGEGINIGYHRTYSYRAALRLQIQSHRSAKTHQTRPATRRASRDDNDINRSIAPRMGTHPGPCPRDISARLHGGYRSGLILWMCRAREGIVNVELHPRPAPTCSDKKVVELLCQASRDACIWV